MFGMTVQLFNLVVLHIVITMKRVFTCTTTFGMIVSASLLSEFTFVNDLKVCFKTLIFLN